MINSGSRVVVPHETFFLSKDFLTKVKRNYQPIKKGAIKTSRFNEERTMNAASEAAGFFPWNPALFFPVAPYLPGFGPAQMPMPPLHPLFQFPGALPWGGVMEHGPMGQHPKWEYGPTASGYPIFPPLPLTPMEGDVTNTQTTWSGPQIPAAEEQEAPDCCAEQNGSDGERKGFLMLGSSLLMRGIFLTKCLSLGPS